MKKYERLDAEKYTGKNHFKLIDNYKSLMDKPYLISNPIPYFNGNCTTDLYVNPWKE